MAKLNIQNFLKHKYNAKPQKIDNMHFDSKKEANYFGQLKLLEKAGEILFFLRQTAFDLPGNIKYRCDFVEFWKNGDIKFVDIKGYDTPMSRLKRKQVEDLYPIKIDVK